MGTRGREQTYDVRGLKTHSALSQARATRSSLDKFFRRLHLFQLMSTANDPAISTAMEDATGADAAKAAKRKEIEEKVAAAQLERKKLEVGRRARVLFPVHPSCFITRDAARRLYGDALWGLARGSGAVVSGGRGRVRARGFRVLPRISMCWHQTR